MSNGKRIYSLLVLVCALVWTQPACAEKFFIAPQVGTLGVGINAGYEFNDYLRARLNLNYLTYDHSGKIDDVKYSLDLDNFTLGLLGDVHPFKNGFRVSGGLYYIDMDVDLKGKLSDDKQYSIGNNDYWGRDLGKLKGSVKWDKFAPYLGIGWGTSSQSTSNFAFSADLGVMYLSGVSVSYSASNNINTAQFEDDIKKERNRIKNKIDDYSFYPVLSLGVAYRF